MLLTYKLLHIYPEQGSKTQNYTRATLRRKKPQSEKGSSDAE